MRGPADYWKTIVSYQGYAREWPLDPAKSLVPCDSVRPLVAEAAAEMGEAFRTESALVEKVREGLKGGNLSLEEATAKLRAQRKSLEKARAKFVAAVPAHLLKADRYRQLNWYLDEVHLPLDEGDVYDSPDVAYGWLGVFPGFFHGTFFARRGRDEGSGERGRAAEPLKKRIREAVAGGEGWDWEGHGTFRGWNQVVLRSELSPAEACLPEFSVMGGLVMKLRFPESRFAYAGGLARFTFDRPVEVPCGKQDALSKILEGDEHEGPLDKCYLGDKVTN